MTISDSAVDDIQLLDGNEGPVDDLAAPVADRREPRWATFARSGLVPSRRRCCPLALVGKRCSKGFGTCICYKCWGEAWDIWEDKVRGGFVYTFEPYRLEGSKLVELITELAAHGLELTINGESQFCPGKTVMVEIRAARN